jgi:hypothetical protein
MAHYLLKIGNTKLTDLLFPPGSSAERPLSAASFGSHLRVGAAPKQQVSFYSENVEKCREKDPLDNYGSRVVGVAGIGPG